MKIHINSRFHQSFQLRVAPWIASKNCVNIRGSLLHCPVYLSSFTARPGGRDCFSFSAFSLSVMTRVYRYRLQRTLNFTLSLFFLILTDLASFLLAVSRKSLISSIFRGILPCLQTETQ